VIFEIPAHFAAPSSSGGSPSFYQCKAAVTCGASSFSSPALGERRHRVLACCCSYVDQETR
jgi:hypothetical protein